MPALDTVAQYLDEARLLLLDEATPYRYPDKDLVDALNIGLLEAKKLRADLFLPVFTIPYCERLEARSTPRYKVPMDPMYRSTLVYYMVGRMQLRDDEPTTDQRAGAFLQKFAHQLMTVTVMTCAPTDRLLQTLKVHVPGVTDDMLNLELFNVMDEFFRRTSAWQYRSDITLVEDITEYGFTTAG